MTGNTSKKQLFEDAASQIFEQLSPNEQASVHLTAEETSYTRISQSKVRQSGTLHTSRVNLTLTRNGREASEAFPLLVEKQARSKTVAAALRRLRARLPLLPEDPHCVAPLSTSTSEVYLRKELPSTASMIANVLPSAHEVDLVGILTIGDQYHGLLTSAGAAHWHESSACTVDASLVSSDHHMVKLLMGGDTWQQEAYEHALQKAQQELQLLESLPSRDISPVGYRAWLSPLAVKALLSTCNRNGFSEAALQTGANPLRDFWAGNCSLHSSLTLKENLDALKLPRFTLKGDYVDGSFDLVRAGQAGAPLSSWKSAARYKKPLRGAGTYEAARAFELSPGILDGSDRDTQIDDGIYLQHLHYLNWSDLQKGRITGLTRYACYQVADGKPIATLKTRRFDDTFLELFGAKLLGLEMKQQWVPDTYNYTAAALGGALVPGMLVENFQVTQ